MRRLHHGEWRYNTVATREHLSRTRAQEKGAGGVLGAARSVGTRRTARFAAARATSTRKRKRRSGARRFGFS